MTEQILRHLRRHGYAAMEASPDIAKEAVRNQLARLVEPLGITLNWDPITKTLAWLDADEDDSLTPHQRLTTFLAWLYLVFRTRTNITTTQVNDFSKLTFTAQTSMKEAQEFGLNAARISKDFPNLFPQASDATRQLNILADDRHLLTKSKGPEDQVVYHATPLLAHLVDMDVATNLVFGSLRGEFKAWIRPDMGGDEFQTRIYDQIQSWERGHATKANLTDALGVSWKQLEPALAALVDGNIIDSFIVGRERAWGIRTEASEEEE